VCGVDVDTSFFSGNFPESCAIDACDIRGIPPIDELTRADWREILPRHALTGDSHNLVAVDGTAPATYLRLRIFPDGPARDCASTARWWPTGNGCASRATSISRPSSMAPSSSRAATCSSDRATI